MGKWVLVGALILLSLTSLKSQNWNQIYTREQEAEVFWMEKQYEKAAKKFQDALKLIPSSYNLQHKVGYCYLLTPDKKHMAIEFLEGASRGVSKDFSARSIKEVNAPPVALYHLGIAYQINRQFNEAISAFNRFKEYLSPNDELVEMVNLRIASCQADPRLIAEQVGYSKTNLGNAINTKNQEFNAVLSGDGLTMAYTSLGSRGYEVFILRKKGNEWDRPRKVTEQIRGFFFKTASLSYDGTELYLVDDFTPDGDIYHSTFDGRNWSKAKKLKKPINTKYNESHASLSPDGKTLYFTSDRPGGQGGLDIYTLTKDAKGRWTNLQNLGPRVNTPFNEDTPFLTPDGKFLFFSSEGHGSIGGFDIYYAELSGSSKPVNLGYPINNTDDNLFFFPLSRNNGYMALYDPTGEGPVDLFQIKISPLVELVANVSTSGDADVDKQSPLFIDIIKATNMSLEKQLNTNLSDRGVSHRLPAGSYLVEVRGEGFENYSTSFTIPENYERQNFPLNILLNPIVAPVIVADVVDEPKTIQEPPVEPEIKFEETTSRTVTQPIIQFESGNGSYTVQVMALIFPVDIDFFSNISGVTVTRGEDGFYRYTVGSTESREEAIAMKDKVVSLGYSDAFVRQVPKPFNFTFSIQLMALRNPVDPSTLGKINKLTVEQGDDNWYRYFVGSYNTLEDAQLDLQRIVSLGYKDAFIRKRSAQ